ncbi:cytochrome P450 [Rhizodiscina lignyota]|uniref:Cytochrome P450 n=1 Tax=Rhizodiscina lignyota TaxID=1504668 RepID=A0A9P4IRA1_9PEZI|nr:cytochrome P450 [Rhizodiscina lignyota]
MALAKLLDVPGGLITVFTTALTTYFLSIAVYRVYFHPLSHIPGPLFAKITSLWLCRHTYRGTEASTLLALHRKYGPVLRIAPNEVDISDGAALNTIYVANGGFRKAQCYKNFDIDGHATVFSALDPNHRLPRAKAVLGMFALGAIRSGNESIVECVDRMTDRLERESERSKTEDKAVNVLNLTRSLALDAVSAYLFGKPYNGIMEEKLSASQFVDAFVAVGRFFYLPNWAFLLLEMLEARIDPEKDKVEKSMVTVDEFVADLVDNANAEDNTYQGRLKNAGFSDHENKAQCKDLMFAGTDSTGMNLATILWNMAKQPAIYAKLREELLSTPPSTDPMTLPYLRAVINEGLRLSMANPTRFPRIVPLGGFATPTPKSYHLPPGTIVGVTPFTLYLNDEVYPSPEVFKPERWEYATPKMNRDHIPFGLGARQCIARNLATVELFIALDKLVRKDVLRGARAIGDKIEILEWFNSKVKDEKIEIAWN